MKSSIKYNGFLWEYLDHDNFSIQSETTLYIRFRKQFHEISEIGSTPKDQLTNQLVVFIPAEKIESFKKACIRLSEIAKEENKDPFQN